MYTSRAFDVIINENMLHFMDLNKEFVKYNGILRTYKDLTSIYVMRNIVILCLIIYAYGHFAIYYVQCVPSPE